MKKTPFVQSAILKTLVLVAVFLGGFGVAIGYRTEEHTKNMTYCLVEHRNCLQRYNRYLRAEKACWTMVKSLRKDLEGCRNNE